VKLKRNNIEVFLLHYEGTMAFVRTCFAVLAGITGPIVLLKLFGYL
jgi:hypothetical protein